MILEVLLKYSFSIEKSKLINWAILMINISTKKDYTEINMENNNKSEMSW